MIYLDASALVTLISGRHNSAALRAFLRNRPRLPLATSTIGFVETVRTLDQLGGYSSVMDDLVRDITEILVTDEVRNAAAQLPGGIRTLDAIHVASAQIVGQALEVLITYDKRMFDVARSVGLPAEHPS